MDKRRREAPIAIDPIVFVVVVVKIREGEERGGKERREEGEGNMLKRGREVVKPVRRRPFWECGEII